MAFYTVRVDEAGNEVNRPRTSRSCDTRSFDGFSSARQPASHNASVMRFINPAAFVEKSQEPVACDENLSQLVPPLDLNSSGETLPSENGNDVTYPIQKTCEVSKITKSDAFSNWLSAKRKLKSYELAQRREMENERQRLISEKKAIAKEKYNEWLKRKAQSKEKPPAERQMQEYQVYQSKANDDDNESNRRAWELNKQEKLRRKKEEQLRASQHQKLLEEKRKEEAARAWESWLAEAPLKPKPVPLNQGLLTLKGTISDIFVNPNPWRDPLAADGCD